jgi:hypothetical protein
VVRGAGRQRRFVVGEAVWRMMAVVVVVMLLLARHSNRKKGTADEKHV